jgi:hypothetical protein
MTLGFSMLKNIFLLLTKMGTQQSPTLGAHTHVHAHAHPWPWLLGVHGCNIIIHGWAWVRYYSSWVGICFVHPCI